MTEAKASPADMTLVRMRHPKIEHGDAALPITTMHAFETIHAKKGWKLVKDDTAVVQPGPTEPDDTEAAITGEKG